MLAFLILLEGEEAHEEAGSPQGSPMSHRSASGKPIALNTGESFQDYSWIQDFEADFP